MRARALVADLFSGMNRLEKRRAIELEALKRKGVIIDWWYEKLTLKLADDTRYTPDFAYQTPDGTIHLEETKGFWREDARIKCKLCAELYPFPLRALVWDTGTSSWDITVFRAA